MAGWVESQWLGGWSPSGWVGVVLIFDSLGCRKERAVMRGRTLLILGLTRKWVWTATMSTRKRNLMKR